MYFSKYITTTQLQPPTFYECSKTKQEKVPTYILELIIYICIMICESFSRVLYYLSQVNLEITNENKSPINNVIISSGHYSLIRCTHTYIYIYLIFSMYSIEIRPSALTRQIQIRVSYTYMCVIHEVLQFDLLSLGMQGQYHDVLVNKYGIL